MKRLLIALFLVGAAGMGYAWDDRGHVHFGVMVGPYGGPWGYPPVPYYYPPYYNPYYAPYYPPVVIEQPVPQTYIEQQAAPVAPQAPAHYWYYCAATKGYYPYIKECPGGWQKVSPQPPAQP